MNVDLTKLKSARGAACLTQQELADKAGVAKMTVCAIERGYYDDVKISTLLKLCNALGIDISFFKDEV